jgi:KDO2-lipid IV(A) lauroyltransferase
MTYWLYRALALLPLPLLYGLGSVLAWLTRNVLRYRRKTVADNLARSFPEKSEAERNLISKAFYGHLVDSALEIIRAHAMPKRQFSERVTITNPEVALSLSEQRTRSVVVLVIHQGNWEWMLHAAAEQLQIPIDPVYKPLHDKGADRFMYELRSRFGAEPVTADTAAKDILRKRRSVRLFALLADQSPGARERKHWNQMLNQETAWHTGAATIARLTKSPVFFAQCRRTRRGHYEIVFHEITRNPREMGEEAITDAYARLAEQAIREQPSTYLWSNRRWKLAPHQPVASNSSGDGEQQSSQSNPSP